MRESSVDIVSLIQIFSSDISRDKFIDLCEQINDTTREFLSMVYDIHCDISQRIPNDKYSRLADAYETELLPYLEPEKVPLNIHLRTYIYYLRDLAKNGNDLRVPITQDFINDMLNLPYVLELSKKGDIL